MNRESKHNWWAFAACLLLAILKLWLTSGQTVAAIGGSFYDDFHFLSQAQYLLRGQWLGPYDQITLIKGPFFPAWIALAFVTGIPLLASVQLLYTVGCGLLTAAVRPLLRRSPYIPILYGFLLFNPESNATQLTRVIREMITPGLTALTAACALGLLLSPAGSRARRWLWACGLGASFAALWLTREEEVVVLPFLLFILAAVAWFAWKRQGWHGLRVALAPWLASAALWAVIVYGVAAENYVHYGVFAKTEFDADSFQSAYGALARVKPSEFKPMVPLTRETARRIDKVSPAFAEIEPYILDIPGAYWEFISESQQVDANRHEILGGWFIWAFRDAVNAAGYYADGTYPAAYYHRLATEVNTACDSHVLDCYPPRATLLPVWHNSYAFQWIPSFGAKLAEVVGFEAIGIGSAPGVGTPADLALFRALTHNEVTPLVSSGFGAGPFGSSTRSKVLASILDTHRLLNPILAAIAMVVYALLTATLLRRRLGGPMWVVLTSLFILGLARIALIGYMNVSSYRVPPGAYQEDAYPAILGFVGLCCLQAAEQIKQVVCSRS